LAASSGVFGRGGSTPSKAQSSVVKELGIGAFSGTGSRPADDCAKETNDLVAKMGIFGGLVGAIFAVAHLNL